MVRLLLLLTFSFSGALIAQPCLPNGISFSTQEELDSFPINYPGCTEIGGTVWIDGDDIVNLDGLGDLTSICGSLLIDHNPILTDLTGLYNISQIGGSLKLYNNGSLKSLAGLENIDPNSITILYIYNNDSLSTCQIQSICSYLGDSIGFANVYSNAPGCNTIEEVEYSCQCYPDGIVFSTQEQIDNYTLNNPMCTEISGDVWIEGDYITQLDGLFGLTSIEGSLTIFDNPSLLSLEGLSNLESIGESLTIFYNGSLTDLHGLENIEYINENVEIEINFNLESLEGLDNLSYIGHNFIIELNYSLINLEGLSGLSTVDSIFEIRGNNYLESLTGLNSIHNIGYLYINGNDLLPNLNGLQTLDTINTLVVSYSDSLTSLFGLDSLKYIGNKIVIQSNNELNDISSLSNCNISECTYISIYVNHSLPSLNGLMDITHIKGDLEIFANDALTDIEALGSLKIIEGDLIIGGNNSLPNFNGLDSLHTINGGLNVSYTDIISNFEGFNSLNYIGGTFKVFNNPSLLNFQGLESLNTINEDLLITYNSDLQSLAGLDNIDPYSIENIHISQNDSLSECDVWSICQYLADPNGTVEILNNAPGCNSPQEVEEACLTDIEESNGNTNEFEIFPNPASKWLNIVSTKAISNYSIEIRNLVGQLVKKEKNIQSGEHSMNIAELKSGLYFYRIIVDGEVIQQGKLIKQ